MNDLFFWVLIILFFSSVLLVFRVLFLIRARQVYIAYNKLAKYRSYNIWASTSKSKSKSKSKEDS